MAVSTKKTTIFLQKVYTVNHCPSLPRPPQNYKLYILKVRFNFDCQKLVFLSIMYDEKKLPCRSNYVARAVDKLGR